MKRENINYLAVGTTVLIGLVLLLVALYKITGRVGNAEPYYIYYENIAGLGEGSQVTFEGYQVGYIARVEPEQSEQGTRYRIEARIREDWRIPDDSVARIFASGLLAETVINIEEGDSHTYLQPGAEINGRQGGDMFAALSSVADDIGGLTRDTIRPLLENLNTHVGTLGEAMSDKVPPILDRVDTLAADLSVTARRINDIVSDENSQRVDTILRNSETLSSNLLALSEELHQTSRQLDLMLTDAHAVVTDNDDELRQTVRELHLTVTTLANSVDGIIFDLEKTGRNMNEFSRQLRANPGVLLTGRPPEDQVNSHD